jgi:hypothetical protein
MGSMAQNKKSKIEISEGQKIIRNRKTKFRRVKKLFETEKRNFDAKNDRKSTSKRKKSKHRTNPEEDAVIGEGRIEN